MKKIPILDTDNKIKTTDLGGVGADSTKFLRGDKTWVVPQNAPNIKQIEIDFESIPVSEKEFVIIDSDVLVTSQIVGNIAYESPTDKELDELEMDSLNLKFAPGNGQFTIYIKGEEGYLEGKFKINYLIG